MLKSSRRDLGWTLTLARLPGALLRRLRDGLLSRRLGTTGFRAGLSPRIHGVPAMRIGANVHARDFLWMEAVLGDDAARPAPELVLGDRVWMSDRVHIAAVNSVRIGADTLIGSGCLVTDHGHGVYTGELQSPPESAPAGRPIASAGAVRIGRNVWLGDNVTVLAGATIGDGAVVGAGSLVRGDIPAGTMAAGTPARVLRRWDEERRAWLRAGESAI